MGLDSSNLDACIDEINEKHIEAVFGASIYGFEETDLDCFKKISHIKQVELWGINLSNIDGLYSLENLELLSITEKKAPSIDYSNFPKLKHIVDEYNKNNFGIELLTEAKEFYSREFKTKDKSFSTFMVPPNIERLEISKANPVKLESMPQLNKLKRLGFHYCRNLESIGKLNEIAPNIEVLIVEKCTRLIKFDVVDKLSHARFINLNGKIIKEDEENN